MSFTETLAEWFHMLMDWWRGLPEPVKTEIREAFVRTLRSIFEMFFDDFGPEGAAA